MHPCPSENELLTFALHGAGALEGHLVACERCRTAVAELHSQTLATTTRGASLGRGTEVGRYVVLELVGEGAMGRVYAAWDPVLDRKVALKLIHALLDGPDAQERLLREARSLARVTHPHLVTVHDAGEFEGSVFIAMEFVDGVTLRTWLASAPRSRADVLQAFLQAGLGLAAAHDAALVHRDFKPENVLVGRDGRVRVSDFGLARLEPLPANVVLNRTSQLTGLVGTPAYMAPEQLACIAADARADQFSFCVALFEALSGSRPFAQNSADVVATGPRVDALLSGADLKALTRGLAVDPAHRFPDLRALLLALEPRTSRRPLAVAAMLTLLALSVGFGVGAKRSTAALCRTGPERVAAVLSPARRAELSTHFASLKGVATFARTLEALDAWSAGWAALHRETCEATRVRGEQSDQVLAARMACLDRRLVEVDGTLAVLATTDAESLPRAPDTVAVLTPLAVCNNTTALLSLARPEDPRMAERVAQLERQLSSAASLKEAGRFKEGLPVATSVALEAHQVGWPPLEAEALLLRGQLTDGLGELGAAEPMLRDVDERAQGAR